MEILYQAFLLCVPTPRRSLRGLRYLLAQCFPRVLVVNNACDLLNRAVSGGGNQRHQAGSRDGGAGRAPDKPAPTGGGDGGEIESYFVVAFDRAKTIHDALVGDFCSVPVPALITRSF